MPRSGRANDWIRFGVHLPPGSERGALVDRPALRLAGVRSGPAYRLALSLSFEWHRPGWRRQPLKRAGKTTSWRQVREPGRYPVLTDDRLLAGAYPTGMPVRRNAVQRARIALQYLVRIGLVERVPGRWSDKSCCRARSGRVGRLSSCWSVVSACTGGGFACRKRGFACTCTSET